MGFTVTDRGQALGFDLVFLSRNPDDDHQPRHVVPYVSRIERMRREMRRPGGLPELSVHRFPLLRAQSCHEPARLEMFPNRVGKISTTLRTEVRLPPEQVGTQAVNPIGASAVGAERDVVIVTAANQDRSLVGRQHPHPPMHEGQRRTHHRDVVCYEATPVIQVSGRPAAPKTRRELAASGSSHI